MLLALKDRLADRLLQAEDHSVQRAKANRVHGSPLTTDFPLLNYITLKVFQMSQQRATYKLRKQLIQDNPDEESEESILDIYTEECKKLLGLLDDPDTTFPIEWLCIRLGKKLCTLAGLGNIPAPEESLALVELKPDEEKSHTNRKAFLSQEHLRSAACTKGSLEFCNCALCRYGKDYISKPETVEQTLAMRIVHQYAPLNNEKIHARIPTTSQNKPATPIENESNKVTGRTSTSKRSPKPEEDIKVQTEERQTRSAFVTEFRSEFENFSMLGPEELALVNINTDHPEKNYFSTKIPALNRKYDLQSIPNDFDMISRNNFILLFRRHSKIK